MHGAQAIGHFAMFIGAIIGIFLGTFFVWITLMVARLRANFWGKLQLSAAGSVPILVIPSLFWAIIVTFVLVAYLAQIVTDGEGWSASLRYIGAHMLVSVGLWLILARLLLGTFNFVEGLDNLGKKQPQQQGQTAAGAQSDPGKPVSGKENNYGLSPADLAEVERRKNAPLSEFIKR